MQRYVYGIIRAQEVVGFDVEGLGPDAPHPESIPIGDGLAMVSTPFSGDQIRPSRRNMLAHTRVLEHVMSSHDVLPMRFGTVLPQEAEGEAILHSHRTQFLDAFDEVAGLRELSLKVFWKEDLAFREIIEADDDLRAKRDDLAGKDPVKSHYERIQFGKDVEAAVAAKRSEEAEKLKLGLSHLCTRLVEAEPREDLMIANFSFLVNADQEALLDEAVNLLDDLQGQKMTFRYVGPMPPFSFVELKIDPVAGPAEAV